MVSALAPTGRVHLVGIGGAGMAVVAELLLARGRLVSGSDRADSEALTRLRALGADIRVGHDGGQVAGAATVVVSSAIRPDNPDVVAARAAGVPVVHRSVALAAAASGLDMVAVAGAHGKTTTSAMLAVALREAGEDPSFAIGGTVLGHGSGAHLGGGRVLVAEADESDGSFLAYAPFVAAVTNIEPDHLDHYGTAEAFEAAFVAFAERVRPGGTLVAWTDDPGAARLVGAVRAGAGGPAVLTVGTTAEHDVVVEEIELSPAGSSAWLRHDGRRVRLVLGVPGRHNVANAAVAWAAGVAAGADGPELAAGLHAFTGTARRFQDRGSAAGVRVVDDYAHNPAKVAAAVDTARRAAEGGRVLVLFQPHLYSRTRDFAEGFAAALAPADVVVLTSIYAAREDPVDGVTSALVADRVPGARYVPDGMEAARTVADLARPGDLVITVGAGDVTALAPVVLAALEERA